MQRILLSTLLLSLLFTAALSAQQVRRIDPATNLILLEIGAVASAEEDADGVKFGDIMPKEMRPEENRDIDIQKGDRVLMMNGKRLQDIAQMREMYAGTAVGDEVKLAVQREEKRFLVSFTKAEEGDGLRVRTSEVAGGRRMMVMQTGGPGGDMEMMHEAHGMLQENDEGVIIGAVMSENTTIQQGDVVVKVNGEEILALDDYREIYQAAEMGDTIRLTLRRGEETVESEITKAPMPEGMVIRRRQ